MAKVQKLGHISKLLHHKSRRLVSTGRLLDFCWLHYRKGKTLIIQNTWYNKVYSCAEGLTCKLIRYTRQRHAHLREKKSAPPPARQPVAGRLCRQVRHTSVLAICTKLLRIRSKKIVSENLRNAHQHMRVYGRLCKNLIHIGSAVR